jgi:hypothetical protein
LGPHSLDMKDQPSPGEEVQQAAECALDPKLDEFLFTHLGLRGLEPFYIEWELIWPM